MLTPESVREAAVRLHGVAHRTPVLSSRLLDSLTGAKVFLKAECFQRAGAFKFRGAYNALSQETSKKIVAASSGNHAQAVALAAHLLGIDAKVIMPSDAPSPKKAATLGYGATIVEFDRHQDDREALQARIADAEGRAVIHAYDDFRVMAGQGTAAMELIEETGELDVLLVPVSGGGLISGCATIAKELLPDLKVVGVEPAEANDTQRSLASGVRETIAMPSTIADGLMVRTPGTLTFPIVQQLVDEILTVSDGDILLAMRFLLERQKVLVEPSGAVGLAALFRHHHQFQGRRTGIVLTGGNVDMEVIHRAISIGTGSETFLS
ncbi:MAG TPA: threonine/serine dehydratase [Fimbriimonas sp.]|nr:threonine/serine dehydratase [Fimbriimonas sp.]